MLSREVATSMRGRAMEALVFPFSFREFLRHRGRKLREAERATKAERSLLRSELETYLTVGGFPEAQDAATLEREVRALQSAAEEHPGAALSLVTLASESIRRVPEAIRVYDAGLWLLRQTPNDGGRR